VFELNARYSRFFPIADRLKLECFAETTNLTNTLNPIAINSTAQVDAMGRVLLPASLAIMAARDQRLIQFGLRASF
jgi:hypothetical protein